LKEPKRGAKATTTTKIIRKEQSSILTPKTNTLNRPSIKIGGADFQNAIQKCKAKGLDVVLDFLQSKARKSPQTAVAFYQALNYFDAYIAEQYKDNTNNKNKGYRYDVQTIILAIKKQKVDVYTLLNSFVTFLQKSTPYGADLTPRTIRLYMSAAKSYFVYNDIDISPLKFRYRVSLPPIYKEDEAALDASDIRQILDVCSNRRLKAYLLLLASGGMRAMEALAIRECDIDWSAINFANKSDTAEPATIRIRKEYTKTRRERHVFISNEAARYLNGWLEWKYRNQKPDTRHNSNQHLVFARIKTDNELAVRQSPAGLYDKIAHEFRQLLTAAGFITRKEDGVYKRRIITFHSFRRFVKTTISNQFNSDYSEWFLGHSKSPYYTNKSGELKKNYKEKCMKYLTFLDYPMLEATTKDIESRLEAIVGRKDKQIEELQQRDMSNTRRIVELEAELNRMTIRTYKLDEFQRQIDQLNKKLGLADPSDLSRDVELYKRVNRDLDKDRDRRTE
jgi:integrase